MSKISIIIPTLNAGPRFAEVLGALRHQQYHPPVEIIVIDSASTDGTVALAKSAADKVLAIPRQSFNHGLTRNLAISHAGGDLIVLLSQDAVPANPLLLANLARNFSDPKVAAAYARHVARPEHNPLIRQHTLEHAGAAIRRESFLADPTAFRALSPLEQFALCRFDNVCSCVRKAVWRELPFSRSHFAEDLAWARRAIESGHKIIYEPDAVVIHSHDLNLRDYYRRVFQTHRALREIFGLQMIPRRAQIPHHWLQHIRHQFAHIRRSGMSLSQECRFLAGVPLRAFAAVFATYAGGRAAIWGSASPQVAAPASTHPAAHNHQTFTKSAVETPPYHT